MIISKEQFNREKGSYKRLSLIKTDKNGTEYYSAIMTCPRCEGKGTIYTKVVNGVLIPAEPDSGVCWKCLGERVIDAKIKVFTAEHAAKLEQNRQKRIDAKIQAAEKKMEEKRDNTINSNVELGYQKINFSVDEWVADFRVDFSKYPYYRKVTETAKAVLLRFIEKLDQSDYSGIDRWVPLRAFHEKGEK